MMTLKVIQSHLLYSDTANDVITLSSNACVGPTIYGSRQLTTVLIKIGRSQWYIGSYDWQCIVAGSDDFYMIAQDRRLSVT